MTAGAEPLSPTTRELLSPRQVAQALGVSESSLKRWCDQGIIASQLTPGGHRRLPLQGVVDFARTTKHALLHPEILGFPARLGHQRWSWEAALPALVDALITGSEVSARQIVLEAFFRGAAVAEIGDFLIAPALHQVGKLWQCGELEVYRERRSCRCALRIIAELRALVPLLSVNQPVAMGGTLEGDYYDIPTALVEVVLMQTGWQAVSLGSSLPTATMVSAIHENRPQLFWLSVSYFSDVADFRSCIRDLAAAAAAVGTRLVVGGQAIEPCEVRQLQSATYYACLQDLAAGEIPLNLKAPAV